MAKPNAQFPEGYKKHSKQDPKIMEEERQKLENEKKYKGRPPELDKSNNDSDSDSDED